MEHFSSFISKLLLLCCINFSCIFYFAYSQQECTTIIIEGKIKSSDKSISMIEANYLLLFDKDKNPITEKHVEKGASTYQIEISSKHSLVWMKFEKKIPKHLPYEEKLPIYRTPDGCKILHHINLIPKEKIITTERNLEKVKESFEREPQNKQDIFEIKAILNQIKKDIEEIKTKFPVTRESPVDTLTMKYKNLEEKYNGLEKRYKELEKKYNQLLEKKQITAEEKKQLEQAAGIHIQDDFLAQGLKRTRKRNRKPTTKINKTDYIEVSSSIECNGNREETLKNLSLRVREQGSNTYLINSSGKYSVGFTNHKGKIWAEFPISFNSGKGQTTFIVEVFYGADIRIHGDIFELK